MPKNMSRNKRRSRPLRTAADVKSTRIHSVKELLGRTAPGLKRVTDQAAREGFWSDWLCRHLPTEIGVRISSVVERDGTLVIFAASAAWCARLRYALQELEPQIRAAAPEVTAIAVRVQPRA
jgi:predicted nucleic acid-binding Zn ribbon protein